jgi:hypothetical protein
VDVRFERLDPPREFVVAGGIVLRDTGRVRLEPGEQVTFLTEAGGEYDVARTPWGFYATPSVDHRLPRFGLRAGLVRNALGRHFVVLVERGREQEFASYLAAQDSVVAAWLDDPTALAAREEAGS